MSVDSSPRVKWPWYLGAALLLFIGAILALHALLNTPACAGWMRRQLVGQLDQRLPGAQLKDIRVGWWGTLSLSGFEVEDQSGQPPLLRANEVELRPSWSALWQGRLRPRSVVLRQVRLIPGPRAERLRQWFGRLNHPPLTRRGPTSPEPSPDIQMEDVLVEVAEGPAREAEQASGPWRLATSWKRLESGLEFTLSAELEGTGGSWRLEGDRNASGTLAYHLIVEGLPLEALETLVRVLSPETIAPSEEKVEEVISGSGLLSGELEGNIGPSSPSGGSSISSHGDWVGKAEFQIAQLMIQWPRLAPSAVGPFQLKASGAWESQKGVWTLSEGKLTLNGSPIRLTAKLAMGPPRQLALQLGIDRLDLQHAIDDLPEALRPPAEAPRVEGQLSAELSFEVTLGDWEAARIVHADLDLSQLHRSGQGLEDDNFLRRPFVYEPEQAEGEPARRIEIGPQNPFFVPAAELPPLLVRAVLLSEDAGFYGHHGFDFDEINHSISRDLASGEALRGGSTLTQQLVKNLFLSREKTLARKIQEALLTLQLEGSLSKSRILELYLNTIEWGPGIYGLGEAAQRYFGLRPAELSAKQAAFLATIIPNPRRFYHLYYERGALTPRWEERVDDLLEKMRAVDAIDESTFEIALATPLQFHGESQPTAEGEKL